jgi:hypothetical protein
MPPFHFGVYPVGAHSVGVASWVSLDDVLLDKCLHSDTETTDSGQSDVDGNNDDDDERRKGWNKEWSGMVRCKCDLALL